MNYTRLEIIAGKRFYDKECIVNQCGCEINLGYLHVHWVCCVALPCCLFDFACFFLPSFCISH